MRYEMRLSAYDVLDSINYSLRVGGKEDGISDHWIWDTVTAGHIPGVGETDVTVWLRTVLQEVLDSL